jgi:hypothetical protein
MSDEQQNTRRKVVLPPVDAALRTPRATATEEEAPVEAVRAIAALLGRAAAPGRRAAAAPEVAATAVGVIGDREVQIQGIIGALNDEQDAAFRDARKRLKRAQRHVEEVLERLAAATPDGLSG